MRGLGGPSGALLGALGGSWAALGPSWGGMGRLIRRRCLGAGWGGCLGVEKGPKMGALGEPFSNKIEDKNEDEKI